MNPEQAYREVVALLDPYRAAFERLDAEAIAAFWFAPTLALDLNGAKVCADEPALAAAFDEAVGQLRQAGLAHAPYVLEAVRVLRDDLLDCTVRWHLSDAAGQTIKALYNVYVLRRRGQGWGIAAVYLLPPQGRILSCPSVPAE